MNPRPNIWTTICMVALLALLGAVASEAKTPDGKTPAEETVCDEALLSGAAYGLCNAYCEAMDCDLLHDNDPLTSPNASVKACLKVLDNFIKLSGEMAPPCEAEDCPPLAGGPGCPCDDEFLFCDETQDLFCSDEGVCEENGGSG